METIDVVIFGSLLALVFPYAFGVFAAALPGGAAYKARRRIDVDDQSLPLVSVVIPAHNEVARIAAKLENTLALDWPSTRIEVLVGTDGCEDGTQAVVSRFTERGVQVLPSILRLGKSMTLNRLMKAARGDLILFTDVSAELPADALRKLVPYLESGRLGGVVPRYSQSAKRASGESLYWRLSTALRKRVAKNRMLLGAHGAAWLARRSALAPLPPATINDDYVLPLEMALAGFPLGYAPEVTVVETDQAPAAVVYRRIKRIAVGNIQMLKHYLPEALSKPRVAAGLVLHKGLKTLGPVFMTIFLVALLSHPSSDLPVVRALVLAGLSVASAAAAVSYLGLRVPFPFSFAGYAILAQAAVGAGLVHALLKGLSIDWSGSSSAAGDGLAEVPISIRALKRTIDLGLGSIGLVLAAPIVAVLAVVIRLESKGSPIFAQERVRYDRFGIPQIFIMYKLRSMRSDAETGSGPVWASEDDPRVTRVGKFVRKSRLDELPQLWNVVRGDMSLIGPRPERPFFVEQLAEEIPGYSDRVHRLRPGVTGWAQVNCGYDTSIDSVRNKLMYDLAYAAHQYRFTSYVSMELRVLVSTLQVMVSGRGAR